MPQKKKWVSFTCNAIIPAKVIGKRDDLKVNIGEPVLLPDGYAKHVVQEKIAEFCDAPDSKASVKRKAAPKKQQDMQIANDKAALEAAQKRVNDAQDKLNRLQAGDDDGAKAASNEFHEARAALADLMSAT